MKEHLIEEHTKVRNSQSLQNCSGEINLSHRMSIFILEMGFGLFLLGGYFIAIYLNYVDRLDWGTVGALLFMSGVGTISAMSKIANSRCQITDKGIRKLGKYILWRDVTEIRTIYRIKSGFINSRRRLIQIRSVDEDTIEIELGEINVSEGNITRLIVCKWSNATCELK